MADQAAGIRAALDRYSRGSLSPVYTADLVRTLRAVVNRCVQLSQSDYPVRAGMAESLLRDIARELGVEGAHQVPVFEPQTLPGEEVRGG